MTDNPTRRDALKALAAATGAVTLASLPTRWSKPTLSVGAIPAHAQVSGCWGLIVTVVSAEGSYDISVVVDAGPNPTMETGTPGEEGWTLYWACQPACLDLSLRQTDSSGGVLWDMSSSFMASPGTFGCPANCVSTFNRYAYLETGVFGTSPPVGCAPT